MRAGCVCQPEKRHWLAAAAHTCRPATIPPELAKIHVSGPQILNKTGLRIVAGKWAQNLAHTPGCCFKFREGPVFGHEIVANKWAQNPDRVVCKKDEKSEPQTWTRTGPCQAEASSPRHCSGRHSLLQHPQCGSVCLPLFLLAMHVLLLHVTRRLGDRHRLPPMTAKDNATAAF